jgi:hypothetical protein
MASATEKLPDSDTYYMGIALAVRAKANCTGNRIPSYPPHRYRAGKKLTPRRSTLVGSRVLTPITPLGGRFRRGSEPGRP